MRRALRGSVGITAAYRFRSKVQIFTFLKLLKTNISKILPLLASFNTRWSHDHHDLLNAAEMKWSVVPKQEMHGGFYCGEAEAFIVVKQQLPWKIASSQFAGPECEELRGNASSASCGEDSFSFFWWISTLSVQQNNQTHFDFGFLMLNFSLVLSIRVSIQTFLLWKVWNWNDITQFFVGLFDKTWRLLPISFHF